MKGTHPFIFVEVNLLLEYEGVRPLISCCKKRLHFLKTRPPHRTAVHGTGRRLADSVERKDRRIHLVDARREPYGGESLDLVALHAKAPLCDFMPDAAVQELDRDRLGRVGKEVQRDVVVRGGRAGEKGADEARLELREHPHRLEGRAAHRRELARVCVRGKEALVLGERLLNLGVFRENREIGDTEAFRSLSLRKAVILVAVLDHEPRGFPCDGLAHHVAANGSLRHRNLPFTPAKARA